MIAKCIESDDLTDGPRAHGSEKAMRRHKRRSVKVSGLLLRHFCLHDTRRDEDHDLTFLVDRGIVGENPANERDGVQQWDAALDIILLGAYHSTDDNGLAVVHKQLG